MAGICPGLEQIQAVISTTKTVRLEELAAHCQYVVKHLAILRAYYGHRRFGRQRFQAYMAKQCGWNRAISKMVPGSGSVAKTLFVVGDGAFHQFLRVTRLPRLGNGWQRSCSGVGLPYVGWMNTGAARCAASATTYWCLSSSSRAAVRWSRCGCWVSVTMVPGRSETVLAVW